MTEERISLEDVSKLIVIDRNALDIECQRQSEIFYRICSEYVRSVSIRDEAKMRLDQMYAELASMYRTQAEENNIKMTEAKLNQLVMSDDEYKSSTEKFISLKLECDQWSAARESFSQRAKMLAEMCSLFISGYFSEVHEKREPVSTVLTDGLRKRLKRTRESK